MLIHLYSRSTQDNIGTTMTDFLEVARSFSIGRSRRKDTEQAKANLSQGQHNNIDYCKIITSGLLVLPCEIRVTSSH